MSYLPNFNTWYAKKKKREDADQTTRSVAVAAPEAVQTVNMPEGKSNDKSAVELPNFTEWLNQRERSGTARYGEATSSTKSIGQFQRLAAETNALAAALEKSYRDTGYQNPLQAYDQLRTDTNKISSLRKRVQAAQDAETNTELAKRYDQMDEALRLLIDGVSEGNNRFAAYSSAQELAKEIVDNGRAAGEARARAEETERLLGMSDEDIAKRKAEAQAVIDAFNAGNIDNILQYGENTPENRQKAAEQEQAVRDATKTLAEIERDEKARNAILNANEEAELYARLSAGGEAAFDEAIQAAPNRGERNRLKEMRFRYQQEQTAKGYKALLEEPDFEQYSEMWRQEEAPERWNAFDEKRLLYEVNDMLPAQAEKNVGAVLLGAVDRGAQYEGLTDTERQIFNYLWYKQGSDDAEKYLQSLNRELNARRAQATMEYTAKQAADSPVTGTLANVSSVFAQPLAAAATAMQQVKNAWGEGVGYYEPLDQNADWFSGVHMDQATREGLKEGKSDAAGFFIDTGLSMLQFGVRLPMGEVASLASMGLSSMGSTAYDVMERGGTTEQAFWSGAAAGVAEVAFEKMGIDRLFAAKGAGKGELVQTILQGMAEEGLEEMGTEVANIVADAIIMGDKSQFQTAIQNYMADGLDEQAARARAIGDLMGQVALSGAGGALMGTVMDPISYGVQAANRGMQTRNAGKALLDSGELGNYLDSVQAAGGDGEAFRQAQALQGKLEAGKKVSAYEAGRLQRANEVALREETMRTLRGRLAGQGLDYAQYHDITSGLEKALQGERMSDGEAAAIAGNPIALEALSELADANVAANAGAVLDTAPAAAFATFGENDPLAARRAEPAAAGRDAGVAETAQPAAGADPDAVQRALLAAAYEANGNAREAFGMAERGAAAPIAREELESNALEGRNGSLRDAAPMLDGETAETRETVPAAHEGLTGAEMEAEAPAAAALAQQRAAQLQEAAAPYGPEAGAFVNGYDGSRSVAEYARAYRRFYDNGRAGVPYDYTLQHSALAGWLSADARQYAYAAGQRAAQADLARRERAQAAQRDEAQTEPGVVQDYDPDMQLSQDQEGQIAALDGVAQFTGRRIRVVETIADDAGQSYANAQFDREAGEIVVALDALDDGMLYAVGHELIHDVRSRDEAGYRTLRDFVVDELARAEDFDLEGEIDRVQELYRRQAHQELDRDGALEEIVAQSYAQVLSDRAALERMAQQDRGLLETIVEFFKGLLEKLDELAGKLAGQDRAAAALRRSEDTLRRMRDLAFAVLEENRGTVLYDSARERAVSFNLKEYSEQQRQDWAASKSIVIYESPEQLLNFVQFALENRNTNKKLYFGRLPEKIAARIRENTGLDVTNYNLALRASEVIKIINGHGNEKTESMRGQRAITPNDFLLIPEVIQTPDRITLSEKNLDGKPVISFEKTIDGRMTVVSYVSRKHRDLTVQTMFAGKIKRNLAAAADEQASANTPEANAGIVPSNTIAQKATDVNTSIRGKGGNDAGEAKFSLKQTSQLDEDVAELDRQNSALREANELLKAQFKLTKGRQVARQGVETVAGKLLREYHSGYDKATLADNIVQLAAYLDNAGDPDGEGWESAWRQANDLAATVARGVLEESGRMNTELYDAYRGFREELRNTGIKVSEEARREVAYQFGSWEQFRRQNFGRIRFTNDGTPLDSLWGELAEKYPGLLDPEANELEQPIRLAEALQAIAPVWENPYGMSTDAAAAELASRLFEEYYKLPDVRTFADKQKTIREQKLGKLRERYEQKMQEQRLAYRSEYERRLRAELQEAKRKLGERLSEREADRLARQKALYEQRIVKGKEKRAESAAMNKYKKRIKANATTLYQWLLRPTDAKHVPEALRVTVGRFLQTISFVNERNQNTKVAEQWRERLRDLKDRMEAAGDSESPYAGFLEELDPDFLPRLRAFLGGTEEVRVVADLKVEQLRELDYLLGIVKRAVTDANKLLNNARYAQVAEVGDAAVAEMRRMRPVQPHSGPVSLLDRSLNLDMLDSFSYFDRLGPAATTILSELRRGFDTKVWDVDAAQQYMKNLLGDAKVREWGGKNARAHTFQVSGGEIALTPGQVMELYLLNKREQARGHIYHAEGGIRPAGDVRTEQGKRERLGDPVRVTEADVQGIIDTLTDEQRRIADGMQQYLGNDVANWGNDVSLRLYGYKKFTEKHYWPIKVDANSVRTTDKSEAGSGDNGSLYALRNLGATKSAQEGAHNALVLRDAFETFAGHVNDMSSYHGLVPALADAMKWFNYPGVKASIDRVAGPGGQTYFKQLIRDINGAARTDTAGVADLLLGHAKVAAVGANARVVLQQPTAYLRAAALISPKYLAEGVFTKEGARKAKQYSAIALWKSWGYYDMNIGRSMREVIVGDGGITQKIREKSLAPAGWADDITWGALWNACEAETKDLRKDLKPGTEAFYRAVADRFAEIVDRTQVVDSVFHRSQLMRSKNGLAKITTPFMAEPIKSYNMLRSAASACRRNPSKANQRRVWRVGFTFVATSVATAAAASIADAFRDDDEERSWLEKWLYAMLGIDMDWDEETTLGERVGSIASSNVLDNLNPLNMIPVVKDIVSMLYGYDPSRLDMQGISRLVQAGKAVVDYFTGDSKYTFYQVIYQAAQAVSSLSGIPVGNLMRTFNSLAEAINPDFIDFTKPSARSSTEIYDKLYEGMISGQQKDMARWRAAAEEKARKSIADSDAEYDDEELEAENRIAKGLAAALRRREPRIAEMGDLQMDGLYGSNEREYAKLQAELEAQGFSPEMITGAVKRYIGDLGGDTNEVNPYDPALHMEDYDLFMAHENEPRAYEEMRKALADAGKSDNDIANMLLSGQNKWAKQNGELEISYDNLYDTVLEEGIAGSTAKDIIKGLEAYGKDAAGIRQSLNGKLKKDYLEAAARGDQQATKELSRLLTMVGNPYIGGKSNAEVLEWLRPKTKK